MKTISKHYQSAGIITLIQLETIEGEGLCFVPAASAIDNGDQEIKVSCVERSRWAYDSPDFKSAQSVMDSKIRNAFMGLIN